MARGGCGGARPKKLPDVDPNAQGVRPAGSIAVLPSIQEQGTARLQDLLRIVQRVARSSTSSQSIARRVAGRSAGTRCITGRGPCRPGPVESFSAPVQALRWSPFYPAPGALERNTAGVQQECGPARTMHVRS